MFQTLLGGVFQPAKKKKKKKKKHSQYRQTLRLGARVKKEHDPYESPPKLARLLGCHPSMMQFLLMTLRVTNV